MASNILKAAVIGAGNMGRNHVRTYANLSGYKLVGLADVSPTARELAKEYQTTFYKDYIQLLEIEKPDVVSVVVPTPLHYQIGLEVIKRGSHLLMEKPIASTPQQASRLIAAAKQAGIVFSVGHIERYNPLIRKIKSLLDQQKVGKVSSIVCKRVGGFPIKEPKTDVIIDLAVHDIDIISFLLGSQPTKLYSHGSRTHHSSKIDSAEILLDYGKAAGFVQANWIMPVKIRTIAVTGSKGYIEGNYITQELVYYKHNMTRVENKFESFVKLLGEPKEHRIALKQAEPLAVELKTMRDAILGRKPKELVSPEDACLALELALKAVKPYATKG